MRLRASISALCSVLVIGLAADAANAACTRLAFSVNDYGKVGPTNDAKNLLDKYIAKWTADRGIKKYTTGKKDVSCELYLDVGLFDEHTCKATASVCWDGPAPAGVTAASLEGGAKPKVAVPKTTAKRPAAPVSTSSIPLATPTGVTAPAAAVPAAPAAVAAPPVAPAAAPPVEAPKAQ